MTYMKKRVLSIVLVVLLIVTLYAYTKKAESVETGMFTTQETEIEEPTDKESIDKEPTDKESDDESDDESEEEVDSPTEEEYLALREAIRLGEEVELPKKLDLRDYGVITPVKDQGSYMTCWLFGVLGAVESNAIVSGFGEYDFSEYQLGILSETIPGNQDESIKGEGYVSESCMWYNNPGTSIYTVNTFMKGYAPALETDYPYTNFSSGISGEAINSAVFKVDNCFMVTPKTPDLIKRLIIENGAVTMGVHSAEWDYSKYTYYSDKIGIDHYVTVVGWDDTFKKSQFSPRPEKNGAWIIKNSWSTAWGKEGYLYLSYCDAALINTTNITVSYTVTSKDSYDYQYQYDGSTGLGTVKDLKDVAISFTAKDNETIMGVKVYPCLTGGVFEPVNATVKVYKNIDGIDNIDDANPIYSMDTRIIYAGYQTIEFDEGVNINKGDNYFVTVTFESPVIYADDISKKGRTYVNYDDELKYHTVTHANPGETFLRLADDSTWQDRAIMKENASMCIKVMVREGHNKEVIHRKALIK